MLKVKPYAVNLFTETKRTVHDRTVKKGWRGKRGDFLRRQDDSQSGETSGGSPQGGRSGSFIRNGLEHEKMGSSLYKGIAAILLGVVGSAFFLGYKLSSYSGDEIAKVVLRVVPDVKMVQDGPTLRKQLQDYDRAFLDTGYAIGAVRNMCESYGPRLLYLESDKEAPTKPQNPKRNH